MNESGAKIELTLVSGGQTGVDRAALDFALERGLPCGGWCPRGRWAEDGPLAARYPLQETPDAVVAQRTAWNVRDADATLIFKRGELSGGTLLTLQLVREMGKPHVIVDLGAVGQRTLFNRAEELGPELCRWLRDQGIKRLNIAGPRESGAPGIYRQVVDFLSGLPCL
ncbi:MAG: putative molybdenum carrier protein [Magnetococcales bacterium]|nr:putative molybdenum carrier protein [Magnetococcales bacterium]